METPHPWYRIVAAKAKDAPVEILIFGDIGDNWWDEESVTARDFVRDLGEVDPMADLNVRINSYGGIVADGTAIYNALRRHKGKVTTSNEGTAASIASMILMAGDDRLMADNAMLMVHAPWGFCMGNAADMRDMAQTLDTFAEAMTGPYMRSAMTRDEVMGILGDGKDHWYSAEQAKAAGLVTGIVDGLDVAATYRNNRFSASAGRRVPMPTKADLEKLQARTTEMTKDKPGAPAPDQSNDGTVNQPVDIPSIEKAAADRARAAMRERAAEIRGMFKPFMARAGVGELLDQVIDDPEISAADASGRLLAKLGEDTEPLGKNPRIEAGMDAAEKFQIAASAAIRARAGMEKHDPTNEFSGRKLIEMARLSLEMGGVSCSGRLPIEIAELALSHRPRAQGQSLGDFDVILENTMHKTLLNAWSTTPDTWSKVCKQGSVSDLREWNRINPGTIGDIDTVNEAGEYKFKAIPDAVKESIAAVRRGNRIAVTPEVIINDDLSYFSDVPTMFGRAARRSIETAFYALLTSNSGVGPTMKEDNKALFHTDHGNYVTSGAVPSVGTIDAGRVAMASQKDVSGNEILDIKPAIWLGPLSLGATARVVNASAYDPDATNKLQRVNAVAGLFRDIVDTGRLTGTAWFMFADPMVMPVFEVVFLDGQTEPRLAQQEDFATAGLTWRVELPFGVGCIGWRGAYQNDGAT